MIGRLDGRGDFETVLISFRRRVLYKNIGKYQNFKGKIYGGFLYKIIFYLQNRILKFEADLMVNLLTIQPSLYKTNVSERSEKLRPF